MAPEPILAAVEEKPKPKKEPKIIEQPSPSKSPVQEE